MTTYKRRELPHFQDGDEDYALWNLFTNARYATLRAREKELQRYRLTPEQARILFVIQTLREKATPPAIAKAIIRQPHTVCAMIARMQKMGLVERVRFPGHKNRMWVRITEKGIRAYEMTAKRGPIHRIMKALDEEQRDQFRSILGILLTKAREELGVDRDSLPSSE